MNTQDWEFSRHDQNSGIIQYEIWGTIGKNWVRILVIEEDEFFDAKKVSEFIFKCVKEGGSK